MTFGSEFAKHVVISPKDYKHVFFDKKSTPKQHYSQLNKVKVPNPSDIHKTQIKKIQELQRNAWAKRGNQVNEFNTLFESNAINQITLDFDKQSNVVITQALESLMNQIYSLGWNRARDYYHADKQYDEKFYKSLMTKIQHLNNMLIDFQKRFSKDSNLFLSEEINELQQLMASLDLHSLKPEFIQKWSKNVNNFKGAILEKIGVAWLNSLNIPQLRTLRLGNVSLTEQLANKKFKTSLSNGRHTGQAIMDLITLNLSEVDIYSIPVEYDVVTTEDTTKRTISTSLGQLLDDLENKSGKVKSVTLDDYAYDTLLGLSTLNTQAKSGKYQLPWNVHLQSTISTTSVAINEFSPTIASGIGILKAFQLLHTLNQDEDIDIADKSEDYNALANYALSTMLAKVLHLSEKEGNQYVLTPYGFQTYIERIEQLFKDGEDYIGFVEDVMLGDDTLEKYYHVTIASKPKGY